MILGKKERRITIAIGLLIGITTSSLLVKYALSVKNEQTLRKPGNYNSLHSAVGNIKFPPLPLSIENAIPNGIVVYFEGNRTSLLSTEIQKVDSWVIETTGSFRSERLFILAEVDSSHQKNTRFSRATEIYVTLENGFRQENFEAKLNKDEYQIIGENSLTKELILQLKHFSPSELDQAKQFIQSLPVVQNARIPDWAPTR